MRPFIYGIAAAAVLLSFFATLKPSSQNEIAVIVPLQHAAMDAIVEGLKSELPQEAPLHIYHAQGDSSLQSAIIQQLELTQPAAILPIGTAATQMTVQRLPQVPTIHLAAKFTESDRAPQQPICGVLDEIPIEDHLKLASSLIPNLQKITLLYSASEKVFPEAEAILLQARKMGIQIQKLMVQNQGDLYTMSQQMDPKSQLLMILKDHTVVAGIATLVQHTQKLGIPLMAADEGSVRSGATFAPGVQESSIGATGGRLLKRILYQGQSPCDLPIEAVTDLHLFYRKGSAHLFDFEEAAQTLGYKPRAVQS